ncbi:hypothetical protein HPP92_027780 [Vanilla planifolia]|uniref:Uncharacterized protein n=1 Tax=Vanilla planifolia TaxID=51239 RepID=A0A835P8V3_VANPL|nr:hypothetical protein HPP92_027780 [Vanilla planifolia]KAG0448654.1 hypothetical protein HPP92_027736 [Vanilla planifolia]
MYAFQSNVVNAEGSSFSVPDVRVENALFQISLTRPATVCLNAAAKSISLAQSSSAQKVKNMINENGVHLNSQAQHSSIHNLNVSTKLKSCKDALSFRNGGPIKTFKCLGWWSNQDFVVRLLFNSQCIRNRTQQEIVSS